MSAQRVDLYQPLVATRVGPPPLVIRTGTIVSNGQLAGGVPAVSKVETYVLLSALPAELQERVKTAIQALSGT
jgi:hypothetical protein